MLRPSLRTVFLVLTLVCLLLPPFMAVGQDDDSSESSASPNVLLVLYLVEGDMTEGEDAVPENLASAVAECRELHPYRCYRLLDTNLLRLSGAPSASLEGMRPTALAPNEELPTLYELEVNEATLVTKGGIQRLMLPGLRIRAKIPYEDQVHVEGRLTTIRSYRDCGLTYSSVVPLDKPVVLGKTAIDDARGLVWMLEVVQLPSAPTPPAWAQNPPEAADITLYVVQAVNRPGAVEPPAAVAALLETAPGHQPGAQYCVAETNRFRLQNHAGADVRDLIPGWTPISLDFAVRGTNFVGAALQLQMVPPPENGPVRDLRMGLETPYRDVRYKNGGPLYSTQWQSLGLQFQGGQSLPLGEEVLIGKINTLSDLSGAPEPVGVFFFLRIDPVQLD